VLDTNTVKSLQIKHGSKDELNYAVVVSDYIEL